jgi:hypothetical protein
MSWAVTDGEHRPRVRLVSFTVQVQAVVDDGVDLTPLTVQPVTYTATDAALFDLEHVRHLIQAEVDKAGAGSPVMANNGVSDGHGLDG